MPVKTSYTDSKGIKFQKTSIEIKMAYSGKLLGDSKVALLRMMLMVNILCVLNKITHRT